MMLRRLSEQDHYQVLEVSYDASSDEIQSAFETARDIYSHEGLVSSSILSDRERRRTFHRISEAYQTLIAEESRRLYDRRLGVPASRPTRKFLSATIHTTDNDSVEATFTPADVAPPKARIEPEHDSVDDVETSEPASGSENLTRECALQLQPAEEATGAFLKAARQAMGLELETISKETKIGRSMLEYIENERLDRLPAAVYLRNFTRQIARCLGLDEDQASKTYVERIRRLQS